MAVLAASVVPEDRVASAVSVVPVVSEDRVASVASAVPEDRVASAVSAVPEDRGASAVSAVDRIPLALSAGSASDAATASGCCASKRGARVACARTGFVGVTLQRALRPAPSFP